MGKDGYDVTVTVNKQQVTNWTDFSVGTKQATIREYKQSGKTTPCSPKEFTIGKVNLIVAKLTANEGYFVWTNTPVSISERKEINNLDAKATLTSVQIIAPDQTTETGWAFANNAAASFKKVGTFANLTDQQIIWKLIKYADANATVPSGTEAANAADFQAAMVNVEKDLANSYTSTGVSGKEITVNNAGVYAVKATTTDTANYAYSPVAAYISFGTYTTAPTDLAPATVNAKKTTIKIEKNSNENDGVVEIGKEVTYTVKTNIPYIADNVTDVTYTITDTIDGANYKTNAAGNVEVSVKIGAANPTTSTVTPSTTQDGKKQIVIDLSNVAANRTNANAEVVITYKAIVTSEIVNNTVVPNDGTHHFTPVTNTLYTGKITITKTDDSEKNPVKLANAGFVIYRTTKENKPLYALVSKDTSKNNNEYVVTGWTETLNDAKADTNLIMTDSNGEAVVRGLDDSYAYNFKEIKAPEGYSVNTTDSSATWGNNQEASNRTGTASMTDTKLSALPETGGIGTTIFTIAGCVIMIAAAGLFFASRKKTNK